VRRQPVDLVRNKEGNMKVLNTSGNLLVAEFNRRLAATSQFSSPACQTLFRRMLGHLDPLAKGFGMPAIQFFGSQPFEYGGRHFGLDATWTYPDAVIDGVNTSFMASVDGSGFQFILFDHQCGTVFERWFVSNGLFAKEMAALVHMATGYCASRP
jgi:hypothetical protein